jgi:menaquinone-dependent protoporphyrinogen oxidase
VNRRGHSAHIARKICTSINEAGGRCEMMDLNEAVHEGIDWDSFDLVALGAPVLYGTYDKSVFAFIRDHQAQLEAKRSSFFNVSVVARTPEKATVEGNRYMQKFLELATWKPRDLKVIAGNIDYPSVGRLDTLLIQMIMMLTRGPTDRNAVIDYTNWDHVVACGRHLLRLAGGRPRKRVSQA